MESLNAVLSVVLVWPIVHRNCDMELTIARVCRFVCRCSVSLLMAEWFVDVLGKVHGEN